MAEANPLSPEEEAFLRGIVAAPEPVGPARWVSLVVAEPKATDVALWTGRAAALRAAADR